MMFYIGYSSFLFIIMLLSLTVHVNDAIMYFRLIGIISSIIVVISFSGGIHSIVTTGFYEEVRVCDKDGLCSNIIALSMFKVASGLMLGLYLLPMILRPLDFIMNFFKYTIGMICYILMMPTFVNVLQIFAICNLNDITWGNRPVVDYSKTALKEEIERKKKVNQGYQSYRNTFLSIWVIFNAVLIAGIEVLVARHKANPSSTAESSMFKYSIIYLNLLSAYKIVFGTLQVLRYNLCSGCGSSRPRKESSLPSTPSEETEEETKALLDEETPK